MNSKRLAEMIKHLRDQQLNEMRTQTPIHISTKGNLKVRQKYTRAGAQQSMMNGKRYNNEYNHLKNKIAEEIKKRVSKQKDLIDTAPEQDDLKGY